MTDDEQLKTDLERSSEAADLNSGGGTIFVGLNDDGAASGADVSAVLTIDPADVTNKIHKYTGTHFHSFEILECQKGDTEVAAIRVRPSRAGIKAYTLSHAVAPELVTPSWPGGICSWPIIISAISSS